MGARSALALLVLLGAIAGGGYWLGTRSLSSPTPLIALGTPAAPASETGPDPADPANEAPLRVGERVEALSAEGWEPATLVSIDGDQARVDYARPDLPDEALDLRLLRRPSADAPPGLGATPGPGTPARLNQTAAGSIARAPDVLDGDAEDHGRIELIRADGEYIGCFRDTSDLDLAGHLERSAQNTPQRCVATCIGLGFAYAAVQYGESCLCGASYGRYGKADNCDYACSGDPGQTCGGYSANAVYATGIAQDPH